PRRDATLSYQQLDDSISVL
ncbi:unnamed protein product, partial [Oikopleura dioica]